MQLGLIRPIPRDSDGARAGDALDVFEDLLLLLFLRLDVVREELVPVCGGRGGGGGGGERRAGPCLWGGERGRGGG